MPDTSGERIPIQPDALGPLEGLEGLTDASFVLFPGENAFYSNEEIVFRAAVWDALRSTVGRILRPGETVLGFVAGLERVFGVVGREQGKVYGRKIVLVVTDARVVEIKLSGGRPVAASRVRSFLWSSGVPEVRGANFVFTRNDGARRRQRWMIPSGGDRKLLGLAVPKILAHGRIVWIEDGDETPVHHCPICFAAIPSRAARCQRCGTTFCTRGQAVLRALVPGLGMSYLRDFASARAYAAAAIMLAACGVLAVKFLVPPTNLIFAALCGFAFAATRLHELAEAWTAAGARIPRRVPESFRDHHAEILLRRKRRAPAGISAVGVVLLIGFLALQIATRVNGEATRKTLRGTGAQEHPASDYVFVPPVLYGGAPARDLDFPGTGGWTGTRLTTEWSVFADSPALRSEWVHDGGSVVSVLAYPSRLGATPKRQLDAWLKKVRKSGAYASVDPGSIPPFSGWKVRLDPARGASREMERRGFATTDPDTGDLHIVLLGTAGPSGAASWRDLEELVKRGSWIPAKPPKRGPTRSAARANEVDPRPRTAPVEIPLNSMIELDFKSKQEVHALRRHFVRKHANLLRAPYTPSTYVFSEIVGGKPWWGVDGIYFAADRQGSTRGASEESRFIVNPFLLVGVTEVWAYRVPEAAKVEAFPPEPRRLTWVFGERPVVEVDYEVSKHFETLRKLGYPRAEEDQVNLCTYNARDLGFQYMAFTPAGSKNIVVKPRGEQPFEVQQFLHLGRSCQQVEGCNNMSGSHDVEEIHVAGLPARVELRLWRKKPAGVDAKEDARVVLNLL